MKREFTDTEIINAMKQNSSELNTILKYLYDREKKIVLHFVQQNSGSKDDALDVFQDAIITVFENIKSGKFKGNSSISSYLYAISKYNWLNKLKRSGVDHKYIQSEIETGERSYQDHASEFISKENQKIINDILLRLGEKCRSVLLDAYYFEYSMKEIADKMGYQNEQVARNKKFKCAKQLKELIANDKNVQRLLSEIK